MAYRQRRRTDRSATAVSRVLPVGYLAIVLVLLVVVLPSALRPPPDPANTSAELSPDAPPDESQEAIVSALQRGTSGTAGAGAGDAGADPGDPASVAAAPPLPPAPPPRFCPGGFGDPPRQVESLYSAPCAPAWQGDNGGATYKNVTATEVRVGVVQAATKSFDMGELGDGEGPFISDEPPENESAAHRTWRVYQGYFNQNFQLWGRQLRFVVMPHTSGSATSGDELRARVAELDEHGAFAVYVDDVPGLEEAARRKLVGLGGHGWRDAVYRDHQPYLYSWEATGTSSMRFGAAYICAKLASRPATFAGGTEQGKPRKFGMLTANYEGLSGAGAGTELAGLVERTCGVEVVTQVYGSGDGVDPSTVATSIARLRAEGVTTVAVDIDVFWLASHLSQADAQSYFPEWMVLGTWGLDRNDTFFQTSNNTQWQHAFGLSPNVMHQPSVYRDHTRAYRSIDPAGRPGETGAVFARLLQIVNGIQMAGPELNPETFRAGLYKMGKRANEPPWSMGGGYGPDDFGYSDDVAEIWWDSTAPTPGQDGRSGAWRYVDCGGRHRLDAIPPGEPRLFDPAGTCTTRREQA